MVFNELLISYQRRIASKLLGNFPMVVQKLVESGQLTARRVTIAGVFTAIKALFLAHETVWVFSYFFPNSRVLLQERLQSRVPLQEFLVVFYLRLFDMSV